VRIPIISLIVALICFFSALSFGQERVTEKFLKQFVLNKSIPIKELDQLKAHERRCFIVDLILMRLTVTNADNNPAFGFLSQLEKHSYFKEEDIPSLLLSSFESEYLSRRFKILGAIHKLNREMQTESIQLLLALESYVPNEVRENIVVEFGKFGKLAKLAVPRLKEIAKNNSDFSQ